MKVETERHANRHDEAEQHSRPNHWRRARPRQARQPRQRPAERRHKLGNRGAQHGDLGFIEPLEIRRVQQHSLKVDRNPYQSVRFLRRDEIVRLGMDRREFGETGWHFTDKPRPTLSRAYFIRSGNEGFPNRTAFLTPDCGTAKLVPLTVGIEMAGNGTGAGPVAESFLVICPRWGWVPG